MRTVEGTMQLSGNWLVAERLVTTALYKLLRLVFIVVQRIYLLATQRHSGEASRSSPTSELRPISTSPRRRSLPQVLHPADNDRRQLSVYS